MLHFGQQADISLDGYVKFQSGVPFELHLDVFFLLAQTLWSEEHIALSGLLLLLVILTRG